VQFVRQIMRENDLTDFDKARLSEPVSLSNFVGSTSSAAEDRSR
jgi:hypothetical protein